MARIIQAKKVAAQKEKKVFGGMFSKSGLYEDKKVTESKPEPKEAEDSDEMPELEKDEQGQQQAETPAQVPAQNEGEAKEWYLDIWLNYCEY